MSTNNKPLMYGIVSGVLVILIGIYLYLSSKGVEAFEDFLYKNDLSNAIDYRDIDYSPLSDTITLENINLEIILLEIGKNQLKMTGHLDTLAIEGASDDMKRSISFTGYELVTDPGKSERQENILYELLSKPLKIANRMGVENTILDGSVAYDYDSDEEKLELQVSLNGENIAGYTIEIELDRARKLASSKLSDVMQTSMMRPEQHLDEFGKVELVSLNAKLMDHGFFKQLMHIEAISKFNYSRAINNDAPFDAIDQAKQLNEKDNKQMAKFLDKDSIEALNSFAIKGGNLNLAVNTEKPVPISSLIRNDELNRNIEIKID